MAIVINTKSIGVPRCIYEGIMEAGAEFNGQWRARAVTGSDNLSLQLSLESPFGETRVRDLETTGDNSLDSVRCRIALLEMRDSIAARV